ncbi:M3 family oligoendopeptidase [Helicobacter mesocricetorum]|uniref:M3 family oligoendopeptidase n=1 Tax=Helicobacter mesocricetorum TaxID=87012 RepID=UPI000CF06335|nr:M3 family oligoendopeptidase [Helicobacter mesocricetorum]
MQDAKSLWDLTSLFSDRDSLKIAIKKSIGNTKQFEQKYKDKLNTLSPKEFFLLLESYENNCEDLARIMTYAFLSFAANTKEGAFYAECEMEVNKAQESLLFFEVEFNTLPKTLQEQFIQQGGKYSYFLDLLSKNAKHQLTLPEEKVLLKTQPVGVEAFKRLFDEHFSRIKFKFDEQELTEEEILSFLYDKNREMRKKAAESLSLELKNSIEFLAYIYNVVRKDLKIQSELRGYESLEEFRHISNQTTQTSVDLMVQTINENVKIVEEYYKIKKKLLNYDRLYDYDRYAPLAVGKNEAFNYEDSKRVVLEAFQGFSTRFYEIAKKAFEEGWIDSHPRDNKRGGAFSHGAVTKAHPYLLLNHTNQRRDVFTMAHELGHTIHQNLSYGVGYLNSDTPLTTAETASVFAEMLLFEKMKDSLSKEEKISLYAGKLEDIFATLFRQNVFTNFERKIHLQEGELSVEEINKIWQDENQKMFGDSVVLSENYALWWSYIPHFIHTPFYCYAYSYGQLLVMALFGVYRKEGKSFVPKYEKFLSLGGSQSPKELVSIFGLDIEDKDFWKIGINEVRILLEELKRIL